MNQTRDRLEKLPLFHKMQQFIIKALKIIAIFPLLGIAILLVVDSLTSYIVRDKIYTDSKQIPYREYAVVLGTAKFYSKDVINQYYKYRLEAAKQLVQEGKVNQLLLSGDNKTPYYNEPKTMTSDLLKMGIATSKIKQDYAGYTTFIQ